MHELVRINTYLFVEHKVEARKQILATCSCVSFHEKHVHEQKYRSTSIPVSLPFMLDLILSIVHYKLKLFSHINSGSCDLTVTCSVKMVKLCCV